MNDYSENIYDDDGNGPYDPRYPGRRVVADKGSVRVPLMMMDSAAPGRADNRSAAVKARDDAHRLMCDRMTRPKDFDPITGKRLVNDGSSSRTSRTMRFSNSPSGSIGSDVRWRAGKLDRQSPRSRRRQWP